MKSELLVGTVGTATSTVGTALQTNEVLQTISLIITIVGALITYIGIPLISWWLKAKKDGKITTEEIKEGLDTLQEGAEKVKTSIDNNKKKEDK